jgi:hypothetical protein
LVLSIARTSTSTPNLALRVFLINLLSIAVFSPQW